ncbi:YceD family protein [Agrilactobacillus yilanensis]|uniref:YceD family protein n=1 Tax=Agrilactobacillus yilanensis TaxID=2485997 RepID=A0ABW4J8R3_9LACO|nr:YceD family protein [Agrilactobacillus yilanensis]
MLSWTLAELAKFQKAPLEVDTTLDLKADLQQRLADILDAKPFKVTATFTFDEPVWILEMHLTGELTVPSTRSLAPVILPIDTRFTEIYVADDADAEAFEDDEVIMTFDEGKFDLKKAVEDNVIISIPTQVLTPDEISGDAMPEGQDWNVISENDYFEQVATDEGAPNPEFAKLKDLFKDDSQASNDKE